MTQAIGTNFSVTLISTCAKGKYGCEITYVLSTSGRGQGIEKLRMLENEKTVNLTGVTAEYSWKIVPQEYATYNVTLDSSAVPATVDISSQNVNGCDGTRHIAIINFTGEY